MYSVVQQCERSTCEVVNQREKGGGGTLPFPSPTSEKSMSTPTYGGSRKETATGMTPALAHLGHAADGGARQHIAEGSCTERWWRRGEGHSRVYYCSRVACTRAHAYHKVAREKSTPTRRLANYAR